MKYAILAVFRSRIILFLAHNILSMTQRTLANIHLIPPTAARLKRHTATGPSSSRRCAPAVIYNISGHRIVIIVLNRHISVTGFEPATTRTPGEDSTKLSYTLLEVEAGFKPALYRAYRHTVPTPLHWATPLWRGGRRLNHRPQVIGENCIQ